MTTTTENESAESSEKDDSEAIRHWLNEIDAARDREEDYRKTGKRVRQMYAGEKKSATPFNITFSNTETIAPALYSATPRPVVTRRYKDDDELGKLAATAGQRMLEFQLDTNLNDYETFDAAVGASVLDSLLPGRGVTTVKYDAEIYDEGVQGEIVCLSSEKWDRVYFGYATKWSLVPWVAFELYYTRPSAEKTFGKGVAAELEYTADDSGDKDSKGQAKAKKNKKGEQKLACVYQIWDKNGGRKVRYVSESCPDKYLKVDDDPLELSGFFNCPRPIQFIDKTTDMVPTSPYVLYETQAEELNSLTNRIIRITKAIKARGIYDSTLGTDIENLMTGDDNELLPSESAAAITGGDINKSIWFMPLETLIATLKELLAAREVCKQTIYEIMGISDILRGASNASETLGAQEIKTRWGSLRLKPKQKEVQRYVRDLMRLMLELAANKFSEDTWAKMTGLPYLTQQQFAQGQAVAAAAAQAGNTQPMQQLQSAPKWADILTVLKNDTMRAFKIDIETNSTIEPEAMEDQKSISDLMAALGGFMQGVGPMVAEGVMPFEAAQAMLLAITRRFRFGDTIEDMIKQMQPPKPQGDDGEAAKKEAMAQQQAITAQQQAMAKDAQIVKLTTDLSKSQAEKDMQKRAADLQLERIQLDTDKKLFDMEKRASEDALRANSERETEKLNARKQLTEIQSRQVKSEGGAQAKANGKYDQALNSMVGMIKELSTSHAKQGETFEALTKALSAPRRRRAVYGDNGRISHAIEEVVTEGEA